MAGWGAAILALAMALILWAPWRELGPLDGQGRRLEFVERIVGRGSSGVEPSTPLPMLVDLHGYGSMPEVHGRSWGELETVVRLIVPAGPDSALLGRSWFPLESETLGETIPRSTEQVTALIEHLRATRPTIGKPLVTGYSQGGVLSFALAARSPDSIGAAFPVAGWLPIELIPAEASSDAVAVIAFHGADDAPENCHEVVDAMVERGWSAEARVFPGVDHYDVAEMRSDLIAAVEASLRDR